MPDKDDLLSKIRALDQLEKEAMTPPPQQQGGIPVIRTLESDTHELIKNDKLDKVHILAQQLQSSTDNQMDSIIQQTVKQTQTKKMIILGSVGAVLLVVILGLVWFILGSSNEPTPIVTPPTNNQQIIPPITDNPSIIDTTVPDPTFTIPPQQTIVDVWPAAREIAEFTGGIKKEENHIIIDVTHFNQVYAYLIQNEPIFDSLGQTFGYMTLDPFRDATIDNKNMRVADGGTGALVYGFIKNNTALLISNSVSDWVQTASR